MNAGTPTREEEFWNSERAKTIVREAIIVPEWAEAIGERIEWNPASGEEVWQTLCREVRSYCRRRPGPQLVLSASDEAKVQARRLTQFRTRLEAFAKLLRAWRVEVVGTYGPTFWDQVIPTLDDPKEEVVVKLVRQYSVRIAQDVVNDLQELGQNGLSYKLADGTVKVHKLDDCGLTLMVEASRLLLRRLGWMKKQRSHKSRGAADLMAEQPMGDPNRWPRVLVYLRDREIKLTRRVFGNDSKEGVLRRCVLTREKFCSLFLALLSVKGRIPLAELYTKHTHKEDVAAGEPFSKKTRNRMSQLRDELNEFMTEHLGPHPDDVTVHAPASSP